jgi:2-phosphosulfolactate phosphatase
MKLSIFHTPERTPDHTIADCAIAVDVLRATSTIVTALAAGAEAVQAFSDLDQLLDVSAQWPAHLRIRAGERGGSQVEGFDFGNSPLACTPERVNGKRLFISTTNGTRTLQRVEQSAIVIAAAMINRQAVVDYLLEKSPNTIWIVGSGWEGSYSLEDTVCAGAIADQLATQLGCRLEDLADNDEVVGAVSLYQQWRDRLLDLFHYASHGKRLLRLACHEDLQYCSELDTVNVVPVQTEPGVLVAAKQPAQVA